MSREPKMQIGRLAGVRSTDILVSFTT